MYQVKQGFAPQNAGLPDICIVVAYMADKTYRLYNREGNQLMPINKFNPEKWEVTKTGLESSLAEKLGAKDVEVLKTNSVRNTNGAVGL